MATLVLSGFGAAVGGPIGGALGAMLGGRLDRQLLSGTSRRPRIGDLAVQTSSYGAFIPKVFGRVRVAGTVVWATDLKPMETAGTLQGAAGSVRYAASFAVALSSRPLTRVLRIWADGKLLRGTAGDFKVPVAFRFHPGGEDQAPDPLIGSAEGPDRCPAYRGLALAVFEDLDLAEFGNRVPSLTFEVEADDGPDASSAIIEALMPEGHLKFREVGPELSGYVAYGDTCAEALSPLVEAFGLTLEGTAKSSGLEGGTVVLPQQLLGCSDRGEARTERSQTSATELPTIITLTYLDSSRDYQTGQKQAGTAGASGRRLLIELPAVLSADNARAAAEESLARAWRQRERVSVQLPLDALGIEAGARVMLAGEKDFYEVARSTLDGFVVAWTFAAYLRPRFSRCQRMRVDRWPRRTWCRSRSSFS